MKNPPAPRSHTKGANTGQSPGAQVPLPSNGQRAGAEACRCLPQTVGLHAGLQLTPNFTFHRQQAHFS